MIHDERPSRSPAPEHSSAVDMLRALCSSCHPAARSPDLIERAILEMADMLILQSEALEAAAERIRDLERRERI
jgi:hypothetical protein